MLVVLLSLVEQALCLVPDTSVQEGDIQAVESLEGLLHAGLNILFNCRIGGDSEETRLDRNTGWQSGSEHWNRAFKRWLVDVDNSNSRTFDEQSPCSLDANLSTSTEDESNLTIES